MNRRDFLRALGLAGLGAAIGRESEAGEESNEGAVYSYNVTIRHELSDFREMMTATRDSYEILEEEAK